MCNVIALDANMFLGSSVHRVYQKIKLRKEIAFIVVLSNFLVTTLTEIVIDQYVQGVPFSYVFWGIS